MSAEIIREFFKMEGCGNHFLIFFDERSIDEPWKRAAKALCDPHFGVGGDGVLIIRPSKSADFDVLMLNPDGSDMGMCGNGIRCVARYLSLTKHIDASKRTIHFSVFGRSITTTFEHDGLICADMGPPSFDPKKIPIASNEPFIEQKIPGTEWTGTAVSMGNPHFVTFVQSTDSIDLAKEGKAIEHNSFYPMRTNVEFVEVKSRTHLKVAVWERGAGATLACGTAASAVLAAAVKTGRAERCATLSLPGGDLGVRWESDSAPVYLTGPARMVFEGRLSSQFLETLKG